MVHAIEFCDVSKKFHGSAQNAVDHVSFTAEEGEFITILGSSGCGKTTLLKLVNRLCEPDAGKILLFGEEIGAGDVTRLRRRIGYVIQQIGLFPHMTVADNIAVVPKLLHWEKERINARVDELLTLVGLSPEEYRSRYPGQLSGGQQQRVGLARARAADPKLMLLDEPFGAVDPITRAKLQEELLQIHGGLGKTFLFVTHDIEEAFRLGNRVIIMNGGRILQFDTPSQILKHPADEFVVSMMRSVQEKERFWRDLLQAEAPEL